MIDIRRYAIGFLFYGEMVLLVNKTHPDWQKGLWNGVGGVIEAGEAPLQAIVREFREETGFDVCPEDWTHFCTEHGPGYELYCYKARASTSDLLPDAPAVNDEGEPLRWFSADFAYSHLRVVGNLAWMLPLAMDWRKLQTPVQFHWISDIKEKPIW